MGQILRKPEWLDDTRALVNPHVTVNKNQDVVGEEDGLEARDLVLRWQHNADVIKECIGNKYPVYPWVTSVGESAYEWISVEFHITDEDARDEVEKFAEELDGALWVVADDPFDEGDGSQGYSVDWEIVGWRPERVRELLDRIGEEIDDMEYAEPVAL